MKLRSHAAFLAMSCALAFAPVQLLVAVPAEAASCASLTSELRELQSRGNRPSAGAQKWQTAKSQQKKALSAAERDFSYLGCNSNASPQCQALSGKVQRMRSNLRAIDRQLAKAGGGNASNQKRIRQLQAALKRQNCGAPAKYAQCGRQSELWRCAAFAAGPSFQPAANAGSNQATRVCSKHQETHQFQRQAQNPVRWNLPDPLCAHVRWVFFPGQFCDRKTAVCQ